ncbi:TPA: ead/Ea22-like family protein [Klebsiella quasipneumoniae subsp. quasipneumoniae]|nr:ead/Ea22-like family protein [Klebsiella quasipneumoniae subsp. quasipneumoniae]
MTTDITELAQREKFEAWARSQQLSIAYGDCGYVYSSTEMAWRAVKALSAELVEALEKAQQYAKERDAENQDLMLTVGRLRVEREELESRTVRLPPCVDDLHGIGMVMSADAVVEALAAAGIKVEAE